jgi:hypothetical protein
MPDRLDRVTVTTRYGDVELPWASRDALLQEIRHLESARSTIAKFEAVGATRPVVLEPDEKNLVVEAIHVMSRNAGGMQNLPEGLEQLRHNLVDELTAPE